MVWSEIAEARSISERNITSAQNCWIAITMANIFESVDTGVSSHLKDPTPYFNVKPLPEGTDEESEKQTEVGGVYDREEVMAAVAELLVFGFHGPCLNAHAKSLLSKGMSHARFLFPLSCNATRSDVFLNHLEGLCLDYYNR